MPAGFGSSHIPARGSGHQNGLLDQELYDGYLNRFLVHAERCITFHNERPLDFPQWMDPSCHNSLVGCMICQNACPMNTKFQNWIEDKVIFREEETANLLNGEPPDKLSSSTIKKLEKLGMIEYVDVLGRNLKAIIENQ